MLKRLLKSEDSLCNIIIRSVIVGKSYILQDFLDLIETGTSREQAIMKFRFGIPDNRLLISEECNLPLDEVREHIECNAHTLEETANEFGLTRERIRQIERKLLYRHSCFTRSRKLKDYLE